MELYLSFFYPHPVPFAAVLPHRHDQIKGEQGLVFQPLPQAPVDLADLPAQIFDFHPFALPTEGQSRFS